MKRFIFLILLLFSSASFAQDELPVIEENVDEIVLMTVEGNSYSRVVFIKNEKFFTSRIFTDDMVFYAEESKFVLFFKDYSMTYRKINADKFGTVTMPYDPTREQRAGAWWAMNRNMNDFRQP